MISQGLSYYRNNPILQSFVSQTYCRLSRFSSQLVDTKTQNEIEPKREVKVDKLYKTIEVEARCADRQVLDSYETFVKQSAHCLGVTISRTWEPFRYIYRRTLLRAPFVKKKYRVQYEMRTYFRNVEFKHLTGSTADTLLEYIERNLPEGVALKVYKTAIEAMPHHIQSPQTDPIHEDNDHKKT